MLTLSHLLIVGCTLLKAGTSFPTNQADFRQNAQASLIVERNSDHRKKSFPIFEIDRAKKNTNNANRILSHRRSQFSQPDVIPDHAIFDRRAKQTYRWRKKGENHIKKCRNGKKPQGQLLRQLNSCRCTEFSKSKKFESPSGWVGSKPAKISVVRTYPQSLLQPPDRLQWRHLQSKPFFYYRPVSRKFGSQLNQKPLELVKCSPPNFPYYAQLSDDTNEKTKDILDKQSSSGDFNKNVIPELENALKLFPVLNGEAAGSRQKTVSSSEVYNADVYQSSELPRIENSDAEYTMCNCDNDHEDGTNNPEVLPCSQTNFGDDLDLDEEEYQEISSKDDNINIEQGLITANNNCTDYKKSQSFQDHLKQSDSSQKSDSRVQMPQVLSTNFEHDTVDDNYDDESDPDELVDEFESGASYEYGPGYSNENHGYLKSKADEIQNIEEPFYHISSSNQSSDKMESIVPLKGAISTPVSQDFLGILQNALQRVGNFTENDLQVLPSALQTGSSSLDNEKPFDITARFATNHQFQNESPNIFSERGDSAQVQDDNVQFPMFEHAVNISKNIPAKNVSSENEEISAFVHMEPNSKRKRRKNLGHFLKKLKIIKETDSTENPNMSTVETADDSETKLSIPSVILETTENMLYAELKEGLKTTIASNNLPFKNRARFKLSKAKKFPMNIDSKTSNLSATT